MVTGMFVSRPNRFIAKVRLAGGEEVTAHVKNTGRCRELLVPGCAVYLQDHAGAMGKRKLRYSLIAVDKACGRGVVLINMDSQAPNKIVGEALAGGRFSEVFAGELKDMDFDFGNLSEISPEKTFGDSRFDFRLTDKNGRVCWMEVKGVTLEDYIASLTGQGLRDTLTFARQEAVEAAIPQFTAQYDVELSGILSELGMADAFDASQADFSAMGSSPDGPLYLSRVLHKTFLALDAQGTRAGAATVVEVDTGADAPGRTVYLDRPFLYLLVDCEANLPLFIGTVQSLENET